MGSCINKVPVRLVLGLLTFLMFVFTQMIRANIYIAIIAMTGKVNHTTTAENNTIGQYEFNWSDKEKGLLLGSFYWCYWITELPGGWLSQKYGVRRVLGISVFLSAVMNLFIPIACRLHYCVAVSLRALQGLVLGVSWPAVHTISAQWIPAIERSKFMSSYHGQSVGVAINYPVAGLLISSLGWDSVFYVTGILNLIWCVAWWFLAYNSPAEHPRITVKEREYLQLHIGKTVAVKKGPPLRTPWISILCSCPFWAVLFASQGVMWAIITLSMQVPSYFHVVHRLDIKTNGFLSGIPDICKFCFGLAFSVLMDSCVKQKKLSITSVRKISVTTCELLPAIFLFLLGYYGADNTLLAVVILAFVSLTGGASSSGHLANIVDISPNFAGTILGIIKTLIFVPGVLSPLVASIVTSDESDGTAGWSYIFYITAIIYIICWIVFMLFGSGEVQSWNEPKAKTTILPEHENLVQNNIKGEDTTDVLQTEKVVQTS